MDPQPDSRASVKLALVEVLDRDGHARLAIPVWRWPITIGRAIDCDVVLDDVHAAARHVTVTLSEADNALSLLVGDTVNGVRLKHRQVPARQRAELPPGEVLTVGGTRLRVRRVSDDLAPERPLAAEPAAARISLTVLLLANILWSLSQQWLNTDPGGRLTDYLPALLGIPVLLVVWSGFWAVGSKLVKHQFDYLLHARIALAYSLIMGVTSLALPLAAFSLGWSFPSRITGIVAVAVVWAMILTHLSLIVPSRRRILARVMGGLFIAGVSLLLIRNYQVHDRLFAELYVTALAPPAFRMAPAVETDRFIDEARGLKGILDAHVGDDDTGDLFAGDGMD